MRTTTKSGYEHVAYKSDVERRFAGQLESHTAVKVYAKPPGWFTVPTPLGNYTPDWAVLIDTGEGDRLYFVVETKSSLFADDLRVAERAKIQCGEKQFKTLEVRETPARYVVETSAEGLLAGTG